MWFAKDLQYELIGGEAKFRLLPDAVPSIFSFTQLPKKRTSSTKRNENQMKKVHVEEACGCASYSANDDKNIGLVTENSGVPGGEKKMISTSTQTEDAPETRRSQAKEFYPHRPEIDSDTEAGSVSSDDASEEELSFIATHLKKT